VASTRQKILKKAFEEGVESLSKKDLKALFSKKHQRTHLFRHDWNPQELSKEGFQKAGRPDDIRGIYYARDPDDIQYLAPTEFASYAARVRPNVEGIPRPGAKWRDVSRAAFDEDVEKLGVDFGVRSDPSGLQEVIQLEPNNVLARILTNRRYLYRILALTGLLGATAKKEAKHGNSPTDKSKE